MPKRDAQSFIASLMSEEEAVGQVTTVGLPNGRPNRQSRKRKPAESDLEEDDANQASSGED